MECDRFLLNLHKGLTDDERTELEITTIAPRGLTEAKWKEIRKSRKRKRDRNAKRRMRNKAKAGHRRHGQGQPRWRTNKHCFRASGLVRAI